MAQTAKKKFQLQKAMKGREINGEWWKWTVVRIIGETQKRNGIQIKCGYNSQWHIKKNAYEQWIQWNG